MTKYSSRPPKVSIDWDVHKRQLVNDSSGERAVEMFQAWLDHEYNANPRFTAAAYHQLLEWVVEVQSEATIRLKYKDAVYQALEFCKAREWEQCESTLMASLPRKGGAPALKRIPTVKSLMNWIVFPDKSWSEITEQFCRCEKRCGHDEDCTNAMKQSVSELKRMLKRNGIDVQRGDMITLGVEDEDCCEVETQPVVVFDSRWIQPWKMNND